MSKLWNIAYKLLGSPRMFKSDEDREDWLLKRSAFARSVYLSVALEAGANDIARDIRNSTDKYFDEAGFNLRLESFEKGLGSRAYKAARGGP